MWNELTDDSEGDVSLPYVNKTARCGIWRPAVDAFETGDAYVVKMDLPGISIADIVIEIHGNELIMVGNLPQDSTYNLAKFHLLERGYGQFARKINLPEALDIDRAGANLSNGVLTVIIPKKEQEESFLRVKLHIFD